MIGCEALRSTPSYHFFSEFNDFNFDWAHMFDSINLLKYSLNLIEFGYTMDSDYRA